MPVLKDYVNVNEVAEIIKVISPAKLRSKRREEVREIAVCELLRLLGNF